MGDVLGVGILGPGNISDQYLTTLTAAPDVEVRFIAGRRPDAARDKAAQYGVRDSGSYQQMLTDSAVDLVVNLTTPQAHAQTTWAALQAGKHVWLEKPLATTLDDARALVDLAALRGLRLGCAPDTILGKGLQTAFGAIRAGVIGEPTSAFAVVQYGGPDQWHPSPEFLFAHGAGPVLDVGPYYVTALVEAFGPIARVTARGVRTHETRTVMSGPKAGTQFPVEVPSHVNALYEFANGGLANVILSFDVPIQRVALEIGGTDAALRLPDPNQFDGDSELFARDGSSTPVPLGQTGGDGRGAGVVDIARSLRAGVPHRASADLALHVLEALLATEESIRSWTPIEVTSRVAPAPLLPQGWSTGASA